MHVVLSLAFICNDGAAYPDYFECDGEPDCDEGEDERNCHGMCGAYDA